MEPSPITFCLNPTRNRYQGHPGMCSDWRPTTSDPQSAYVLSPEAAGTEPAGFDSDTEAAPSLTGAAGEGNPHLTSQYPPINDARLAMIREWVIEARRVHHYDPQNHSAHHYAYAVPELLQALAVASTEAAEAKERVGIQGVRIADLSKRNEILADDSHSSGREIAALRARLQEETRAAAEARERAAELMTGLLMEWMDETEPHSLTYDNPDEFLKDQGVHRKFFQLKAAACGLGWPLHEATIGISAALPLVGEEGKEGQGE